VSHINRLRRLRFIQRGQRVRAWMRQIKYAMDASTRADTGAGQRDVVIQATKQGLLFVLCVPHMLASVCMSVRRYRASARDKGDDDHQFDCVCLAQ
jgi:hypothetical protein